MPAVEVDTVLDPNEKLIFDDMVTHLRADDPRFRRRIGRLSRPRRRMYAALAILLWTMAPVCIVYGGWTGVLLAAVGSCYGAYLMTHRHPKAAGRSSSSRRPGATPLF